MSWGRGDPTIHAFSGTERGSDVGSQNILSFFAHPVVQHECYLRFRKLTRSVPRTTDGTNAYHATCLVLQRQPHLEEAVEDIASET